MYLRGKCHTMGHVMLDTFWPAYLAFVHTPALAPLHTLTAPYNGVPHAFP